MAYFNELPNIEYLSRFANQSSNEDYTLAKNIFRRAKLREDIAGAVTVFQYYQIKDGERPDQIADRIYGDPELDWVILITNNITSYPSQWTLTNEDLYEYLIDKYVSEDTFTKTKYFETIEIRDEYQRLVIPKKLKVDPDICQEFNTVSNKNSYDLKKFPINNEQYPFEVNFNLGQYLEVWERNNQGVGEAYNGPEYQITDIRIQQREEPIFDNFSYYPEYSRINYSNLFVYGRTEIKNVFIPNSLYGWPSTWGGELTVYNRDLSTNKITIKSNSGVPINITNQLRLYGIYTANSIDTISYYNGTTLINQAGITYNLINLDGILKGKSAKFNIKRNNNGKINAVTLVEGGNDFIVNEEITIKGSQIGGVDIIDDLKIKVDTIRPKAQFKFNSIGDINYPLPGLKVTICNVNQISYLNTAGVKIDIKDFKREVTNYEYEVDLNEDHRKILLLKPEYLGVFISDMKNIMSYAPSSETIDNKTKRVYNSKITEA